MSWAEVKILNSDLTTPLNIAALINHIDLIGSSYISTDADKLKALVLSNELYGHEVASSVVVGLATSTQLLLDSVGYICICKLVNTPYSTFTSFADVVTSETAMTAIVSSETAMTAVVSSETAMTAVVSSETALNSLVKSDIAKTALIANQSIFNTVSGLMLSTMDSSTSYFTKTAVNDRKYSNDPIIIGSSNSFVYVKLLGDTQPASGLNWTKAQHNHNNIEMIHSAFPTGTGQGTVTINAFAVGGFYLLSPTDGGTGGLTYTTDKYEAL